MRRSVALAVLVSVLGGCTRGGVPPVGTAPPPAVDFAAAGWSSTYEAAVQTYGYGPDPHPVGLTYQPDVVVVEGGPSIIRGASADGLVWTIDGRAHGARDLTPGKVMFATARAVGRVVSVRPQGDNVVVTVLPVTLGELVKDGVIHVDQDIDAGAFAYRETLDLTPRGGEDDPAQASTLSPAVWHPDGPDGPVTIALPTLRFAAQDTAGNGPQIARKNSLKVTRGAWEYEPYIKTDGTSHRFGIKVQRALGGGSTKWGERNFSASGLKIGLDASLYARNLHVTADVPIDGGRPKAMSFRIAGFEELEIDIAAGVTDGLKDNQKVRFEVPVELVCPLPPAAGGIPFVIQAKFKVFLETAFSAKNSTLTAHGRYGIDGPLALAAAGGILAPKMVVLDSMTRSLDGISAGANGFVWAAELRILIGVGTGDAMFGPYGKVTFSLGLWRGSDFGKILAVCRGGVLKVDAAIGMGFQVSTGFDEVLEKILGKKVKLEGELMESTVNLWKPKPTVWPDVPLCRIS